MTIVEIPMNLTLECQGDYRPGTGDYFNSHMGNWHPGDPEEIDNFKVFLCDGEHRVDITDALSFGQLDELEEKFCQACRDE